MYPALPESPADLVPLPLCEGPKLKPFDFGGPQRIEFLEYLGHGLHSHVVKVNILGKEYALKLFRFNQPKEWVAMFTSSYGDVDDADPDHVRACYNHMEAFNAECRAFGRLQEAGHEELAIECFGYVLLDEEHERALAEKFADRRLEFEGSAHSRQDGKNMRGRFSSRADGEPSPIRGIVKEFGQVDEGMTRQLARKTLRDVVQLQQLGIINLDVAERQLVNRKIADFSMATTTPHPLMNPEMNPRLTPESIALLELETFRIAMNDYLAFDAMLRIWNDYQRYEDHPKPLSGFAFPGGRGHQTKYQLRRTPAREPVWTYVNPRTHHWRAFGADGVVRVDGAQGQRRRTKKTRPRLTAHPRRWYYHGAGERTMNLLRRTICEDTPEITWELRDGYFFPSATAIYIGRRTVRLDPDTGRLIFVYHREDRGG